ncbi:hypothetical protein N44_03437 [Microcystis aeruginosa NIES-44]|uniref:Uncharacterized protein n=1 Tax=Microcystis aeruginosa NIES-44 TaxID=449439 RepID=A0A0A1VVB8_MICAE|nr:hypothetical protein N44_03437 [Microcystis aeruginosa NIES-44]
MTNCLHFTETSPIHTKSGYQRLIIYSPYPKSASPQPI